MDLSKKNFKLIQGEIASTFALLSLFAIVIGSYIGTQNVIKNKMNSYFSSAQEQVCPYESSAQILIGSRTATNLTGFHYTTKQYDPITKTAISTDFAQKSGSFPENPRKAGELESYWHPSSGLPQNFQNKFAQTELYLPYEYVVDYPFCSGIDSNNPTDDPCAKVTQDYKKTIKNIPLRCGVSLEYGWVVKLRDTTAPTSTPTPTVNNPTITPSPSIPVCKFSARAEVRKFDPISLDDQTPLRIDENSGGINFGVSNDKQNQISAKDTFGTQWVNRVTLPILNGDYAVFKYYNDYEDFLPNKPTALYHKGDKASVSLIGLNQQKWRLKSIFCEGSGCPTDISTQNVDLTIDNFPVDCGVDTTYGWVVELIPTATQTPTPSPTSLPSPTPTPQDVVACGDPVEFSGGPGTHTLQANLGSKTGTTILDFDAYSAPDRFRVNFDGKEVINTGFRGAKHLEPFITPTPGQITTVTEPGKGMDKFEKNTSTATAIIYVDAPLDGTAWQFTLLCPGTTPTPYPTYLPTASTDVNKDGFVNTLDFIITTRSYGKFYRETGLRADVNKDGLINGKDTSAVLADLGKSSR